MTRAVYAVEDAFEKLPIHWMWWPAIGAVAVGVVGYFAPRTMGVGYDNIEAIVGGTITGWALALLCAMKFVSWSISLGSGTSGGTLAPLFTIGGGLGARARRGSRRSSCRTLGVDPRIAALVGMAAMFAGASRALLASVVFAFETTRQPIGLLPLLGGCAAAYLVSCLLMRNSIMTEKIARRGVRVAGEYVADFLSSRPLRAHMSTAVITFAADDTLGAARAPSSPRTSRARATRASRSSTSTARGRRADAARSHRPGAARRGAAARAGAARAGGPPRGCQPARRRRSDGAQRRRPPAGGVGGRRAPGRHRVALGRARRRGAAPGKELGPVPEIVDGAVVVVVVGDCNFWRNPSMTLQAELPKAGRVANSVPKFLDAHGLVAVAVAVYPHVYVYEASTTTAPSTNFSDRHSLWPSPSAKRRLPPRHVGDRIEPLLSRRHREPLGARPEDAGESTSVDTAGIEALDQRPVNLAHRRPMAVDHRLRTGPPFEPWRPVDGANAG